MSTIALCIPAYNAAWCLPRLLTSAQKQHIPFDEILVYNDCSTDNTSEVARQYGATVLEGDINRGCSTGKNRLAEIAKSDWLHFHDADDDLLENFTELSHKNLSSNKDVDIYLYDYLWVDAASGETKWTRVFDEVELKGDPIKYAILSQINAICGLYKREKYISVGGYDLDKEILYNEDVAFHIKLALNGWKFAVEHEISIVNYYYPNSMSSGNELKCALAHFAVLRNLVDKVDENHHEYLGQMLIKACGLLAGHKQFTKAAIARKLAFKISNSKPEGTSKRSFFIIKNFGMTGIVIREYLIRIFQPKLRKDA
jgi:glycosyltransferase involved in cell wall biosynthesis